MTSVYNIGCFFGALSTVFTGDWLGRPKVILLGSTVIAVGAIIQTACWSVPQVSLYIIGILVSLLTLV
jgi:MFS family permease